ncbi:hypothetical protein [Vibrio sp. B1Z05]|uniref:hypothetical protein n=1 Tax=Vibrio sp. B1Z05 TaxID=2654980 RepID=UPI0020A63AD8|nr:hypothetical protein [Vibrio sp. B1Z05]
MFNMDRKTKFSYAFLLSILVLLTGCQTSSTPPAPIDPPNDPILKILFDQVTFPEGFTAKSDAFVYAYADLNGDNEDELFVLMQDAHFCEAEGCTGYLFDSSKQLLATFTSIKRPILLSRTGNHQWKNIVVASGASLRLLRYDGQNYPFDATSEPIFNRKSGKAIAHKLVVNSDLYQDGGYQLSERSDLSILTPVEQFKFQFKRESDSNSVFIATANAITGNVFFSKEVIKVD